MPRADKVGAGLANAGPGSGLIGRLVCDADYRITSVDASLAGALGYDGDQLTGRRAIDLVDPADRLAVIDAARATISRAEPMVTASCSFLCRSGVALPVQLAVSAFRSDPAGPVGLVCAVILAGDGEARAAALLASARLTAVAHADLLRLLHTAASAANAAVDLDEAADAIVPGVCLHFGWRVGALVRWRTAGGARVPDESAEAAEIRVVHGAAEWPFDRPRRPGPDGGRVVVQDGEGPIVIVPVSAAAALAFAGGVDRANIPVEPLAAMAADCARVVDRAAAMSRVQRAADTSTRRLARHSAETHVTNRELEIDTLTGLATRSELLDEMNRSLASASDFAVLLIDLDDFKVINDTHGHDTGDEVLVQVANRLRACVRPDDLVVRFGGDEFVVLCRMAEAAETVAQRVVALLAPPIVTAAGPVTITASVGISDRSIPVDAAGDLLTRADTAMYWAKRLGKHRYFAYDDTLHAQAVRDKQTESLLRTAIGERRVVVHYQPILSTMGATVVGVEAMARLIDDDGRIRLPGEFLPVAERTGLIAGVDAWMLAESCRRVAAVGDRLGRPLTVSVNISAQLAARPDLIATVTRAASAAGLPLSALMLELTESTLIQAGSAVIHRLGALRDKGVRLALDNFGAGYSPLAFLRRLPLTHVKVDRPCINRMLSDERDAAMLEAVTWLVDQLGLTWIAEGVETDAQWEAVRRFGPGFAQGYLFAAPLSEDELVRTLRAAPVGAAFAPGLGGLMSV